MSRGVRRLAASVSLVAQLAVLYLPSAPAVPAAGLPLDKVVHAAVFALATCTLIWADVPRTLVVVAMLAQAVGSELVQARVLTGRGAESADVVADIVGIGIGLALVRWPPHPTRDRSGDPNHPAAPA